MYISPGGPKPLPLPKVCCVSPMQARAEVVVEKKQKRS